MTNATKRKQQEQTRATQAYKQVKEVVGKNYAAEYKAYSKKLPMLIKTNGLGATLAFVLAKGNKNQAYKALYQHLGTRLTAPGQAIPLDKGDLTEAVIKLTSRDYKIVTAEILVYLNWLRRFAEALIEGDDAGVSA